MTAAPRRRAAAQTPPGIEIDDKPRWNAIVDAAPDSFFTQLWEWGEVRRPLGWAPVRVVWPRESSTADDLPSLALQANVRRIPLAPFAIAHVPGGPIGELDEATLASLGPRLRAWGRTRRIATVVAHPPVDETSPLGRTLAQRPWSGSVELGERRVHVLDLEDGVDPWTAVRKKHREWVRKAERAGVEVSWTDQATPDAQASAAMDQFERVYGELIDRLALVTHGAGFTRAVFDTFRAGGRAQLATATRDGVPVAAMLHVTWGSTMLWYAGGQAEAGNSVGAGKFLLWRSIQRAQELGFRRYHMWGTATDSLAHYKEGFGAREVRYVGTRSLRLDPLGDRIVAAILGARTAGLVVRRRFSRNRGRAARTPRAQH
jgi:hypothetical protein